MITRTYLKGCDWCKATGQVSKPHPYPISTSVCEKCPVCNGTKTILVSEIIEP